MVDAPAARWIARGPIRELERIKKHQEGKFLELRS